MLIEQLQQHCIICRYTQVGILQFFRRYEIISFKNIPVHIVKACLTRIQNTVDIHGFPCFTAGLASISIPHIDMNIGMDIKTYRFSRDRYPTENRGERIFLHFILSQIKDDFKSTFRSFHNSSFLIVKINLYY